MTTLESSLALPSSPSCCPPLPPFSPLHLIHQQSQQAPLLHPYCRPRHPCVMLSLTRVTEVTPTVHPSARPQLFTLCLMTTVILSLDPIIASIAPRACSQVNSSPTRPFCPPHSLVPSCSLSVFRLSGLLSSPWTHQGYFCPVSLPSCCDPRSYMAVSHHLRFNLNVTPVE